MDRSVYAAHAALESDHWWFAARRKIVTAIMDRLDLPPREETEIYEIGCGTGGNLEMLTEYGRVFASEMDEEACAIAGGKCAVATVERGYLPEAPRFADKPFDLIVMLDVLEHIPDDAAALRAIKQHMREDTKLLLTVPAYTFLWSHHDVLNHHHRRYTRKGLVDLLQAEGYTVSFASYFNTILFPLAAFERLVISRFRPKQEKGDVLSMPPGWLNRLVYSVFSLEAPLLKNGVGFSFGISIAIVAERADATG